MDHLLARRTLSSTPLSLLAGAAKLRIWAKAQPKSVQNWLSSTDYRATHGQVSLIPGRDGKLNHVLLGVTDLTDPWQVSRLPALLPKGRYYLPQELTEVEANAVSLGWALGCYRFERYKSKKSKHARLVWPERAQQELVSAQANALALGRDLVTTPAEDMGPAELAQATRQLADAYSIKLREVKGERLLEENYPSIYAVGRASERAPRLLDFVWGNAKHPRVTLVGKGVCFDTGGLDIKPAESMKLMKKDMGGAATVLALAAAVMELKLPVRLRVLIPAVENSVAGNAFRPLDVLQTRKGITVEVGHTDAEGRLVLSDALTDADAEKPDLLIDVATLTGAARVALGTSLPALFASRDETANGILHAGVQTHDPLWRLPLHRPYRQMLDSKVADINNVASGSYGGAITAALFLNEFVAAKTDWVHVDTMAYNLENRPGRPAGGEVFAVRALLRYLMDRYGS